MGYRTERDSLGEVRLPEQALYGAQTQRAVDNFHIAPRPMPPRFLRALAQLKAAAAEANQAVGALDDTRTEAIVKAAEAVAAGRHLDAFPVPVLQTGSGTSTNMNMNEVLARLASLRCGEAIHPNDHVNCSQSSNDIIPSALQVSTCLAVNESLLPALDRLEQTLRERAAALSGVVKTGRTHLMDAMPVTLGFELATFAEQVGECRQRLTELLPRLCRLPLGGSAVGTGVNVPSGYVSAAMAALSRRTGQPFTQAQPPSTRMAAQDVSAEVSGAQRGVALVLVKLCNDLRWMGSGPLAGLGELRLEALQPGSSIMPGKVNPVIPEAVLMAAVQVQGNDSMVALAAQSGNFQLNVMLPLIAERLLESTQLLADSCTSLCGVLNGLEVLDAGTAGRVARNPVLVTALNPVIGYEAAARIAKQALAEDRPVLDVALEHCDLEREELESLLDPARLATPSE